jgi:hypothetical protein
MKQILLSALVLILCTVTHLHGQTPQAFKYQTIARDLKGNPLSNQLVSFRISIIKDAPQGVAVYQETQTATTSQLGLVNLSIGTGTVTMGKFYYIK